MVGGRASLGLGGGVHFYANEALNTDNGDDAVWHALREATAGSDGVAYYHYPVFAGRGAHRREPGIVLVLRTLGVLVVDILGCDLADIARIDGDILALSAQSRPQARPFVDLDDHLHEVRALVEREHELRGLLPFIGFIVLQRIARAQWVAHAGSPPPATLLFQDDLNAAALRVHLVRRATREAPSVDDAGWSLLLGAFRGRVREHDRWTASAAASTSPLDVIRAVEGHVRFLDEQQDRVACEIPEGPQRIRGLAGSGKTVLLCRRAAFMHAKYPDWQIALVYFSKGLYQALTALVADHFRRLTGEEMDSKRLRILHAWGSREQTGFYRELCEQWRKPQMSFDAAKRLAPRQGEEFDQVCADLERRLDSTCKPAFDAVLIDEGQDLPPEFYRLAHRSLREPKRLTWAYDEAQGIGSLVVPASAEVFGRAADGTPLVDIGAGMDA